MAAEQLGLSSTLVSSQIFDELVDVRGGGGRSAVTFKRVPEPSGGPNSNGCSACPRLPNGNITTGNVGKGPETWAKGHYNHWVIDSVQNLDTTRLYTKDETRLAACEAGQTMESSLTWKTERVSVSGTEYGGSVGGSKGGAEFGGSGTVSRSESIANGSERGMTIDCAKTMEAHPGAKKVYFWQKYTKQHWKGRWIQYDCVPVVGCSKLHEQAVEGTTYTPTAEYVEEVVM